MQIDRQKYVFSLCIYVTYAAYVTYVFILCIYVAYVTLFSLCTYVTYVFSLCIYVIYLAYVADITYVFSLKVLLYKEYLNFQLKNFKEF